MDLIQNENRYDTIILSVRYFSCFNLKVYKDLTCENLLLLFDPFSFQVRFSNNFISSTIMPYCLQKYLCNYVVSILWKFVNASFFFLIMIRQGIKLLIPISMHMHFNYRVIYSSLFKRIFLCIIISILYLQHSLCTDLNPLDPGFFESSTPGGRGWI